MDAKAFVSISRSDDLPTMAAFLQHDFSSSSSRMCEVFLVAFFVTLVTGMTFPKVIGDNQFPERVTQVRQFKQHELQNRRIRPSPYVAHREKMVLKDMAVGRVSLSALSTC